MSLILPTHLTKDADGTTIQATGNYSVTPAKFKIQAVEGILECKYILIQTKQTDSLWTNYAGLTLTNGIIFRIENAAGQVIRNLFGGRAFKTFTDFQEFPAMVWPTTDSVPRTISVQVVLPLDDSVTLRPDTDTFLVALLNDDYTAGTLTSHTMWLSKDKGGF